MTPLTVEALVRQRIGLDPASLGPATLSRAVEGRMRARGATSAAGYVGLLAADPAEWAALQAELVVPETWFFRGGWELFRHLAQWVRRRAAARPNGPPVRVLSVPCSSGEEPYSLAIALAEEGVPRALVRIDGVDLSPDQLRRADAARYTAFSFREVGPDPRPRYFREVEPGRWELLADTRTAVRFRAGNVADPGFLAGEPPYDLILCRNLFIYLTDEVRERAVAQLDRLLAPDGRLCLTAAEADQLPPGRFRADGPASLAVFRRTGTTDDVPPTRTHRPAPAKSTILPPPPARPPEPRPVSRSSPGPRELADAGRLDEARAACERALAADPSAGHFSLLGTLHLAAGRPDDATAAFRKALYLDPDHPEALTHMIVLCEQRGEPGQAAGLRRRLARLDRGAL